MRSDRAPAGAFGRADRSCLLLPTPDLPIRVARRETHPGPSAAIRRLAVVLDRPAAADLTGPLPAKLLPLTPAEYNAGTAGPILASARMALGTAPDDLKSAEASAKACRDTLR